MPTTTSRQLQRFTFLPDRQPHDGSHQPAHRHRTVHCDTSLRYFEHLYAYRLRGSFAFLQDKVCV